MFRDYHRKMLHLKLFEYENKCKLIPKGWQFRCHLITGKNDMDLSLENVYLILYKYDSLYRKGWQFSCHLITGRNVMDLLFLILLEYEISVSLYHKVWRFSCRLITGRNVKDLSLENVSSHIVLARK